MDYLQVVDVGGGRNQMKARQFLKQFNWRFLVVRILVNAIALALTAAIVPKIYFVDKSIWNWLLMAIMLGVLNALIKPVLQILTMQFLFVTFGLVIVAVNALILLALSFLFPMRFAVDNLLWALVGGLVLGLFSSFFESLLGLTMPIVPDEPPQLRRQLEEQAAHHIDWLTATPNEAEADGQAQAIEPLDADANAAGMAAAESSATGAAEREPAVVESDAARPVVGEPVTTEPDAGPSPRVEVEAEMADTMAIPSVEESTPESPEPAPEEPREGRQEDGS
jgi:putative membrane protein